VIILIPQGPKLRVGTFENDKVLLIDGQKFTFDMKDEPGDNTRVRLPHPAGADGKVVCEVVVGGALSNRKGVNTPTIVLPISPMTPKDRKYVSSWSQNYCILLVLLAHPFTYRFSANISEQFIGRD
jgi:pyruvate kinase